MRGQQITTAFFLFGFILIVAMLPGCNSGAFTDKPKKRSSDTGEFEEVARTALVPSGYGKVTGKVLYDGNAPSQIKQVFSSAHIQCCEPKDPKFARDEFEQQWVVDPATKGVKNVAVVLQPPDGKFFELPADQQKPKGDVTVDQPYCAFHPRIFVLFPSYVDKEGAEKGTGQVLVVKNSANCEHNYNIVPNSTENRGGGKTLGRGQEARVSLVPQSNPITIKCDIHTFMRSYGFILDHPYAAVTDDKGNFVIDNAPLGVDLRVLAWHEGPGFFNGGEQGKMMKLQADQVLELPKIKSR